MNFILHIKHFDGSECLGELINKSEVDINIKLLLIKPTTTSKWQTSKEYKIQECTFNDPDYTLIKSYMPVDAIIDFPEIILV